MIDLDRAQRYCKTLNRTMEIVVEELARTHPGLQLPDPRLDNPPQAGTRLEKALFNARCQVAFLTEIFRNA